MANFDTAFKSLFEDTPLLEKNKPMVSKEDKTCPNCGGTGIHTGKLPSMNDGRHECKCPKCSKTFYSKHMIIENRTMNIPI